MEINLNSHSQPSQFVKEIVNNSYPPNKQLTEDQLTLLKESFDLFDSNRSGAIDIYEVKLVLKAFNFKTTKEELRDYCTKYNVEQGRIHYDNYIDLVTEKFGSRSLKDEAIMAFDLFDEERKGKIGLKNLKKAVKDLDEKISDSDLKAILDEFDTDNDGCISKEDFLRILDEYYFN